MLKLDKMKVNVSSSSLSQTVLQVISISMAMLIGFDKKGEKLEFRGHSKLDINHVTNYLIVEPKDKGYKKISASFKCNYVMKKNIMFVFADHSFLDFCLVFKDERICKKVFGLIIARKTNVNTSKDIYTSFIIPIVQTIASQPNQECNSDLIQIISNWIRFLDDGDKDKYTHLLTAYNIHDLIFSGPDERPPTLMPMVSLGSSHDRHFDDMMADIKEEIMPESSVEESIAYKPPPTVYSCRQTNLNKPHLRTIIPPKINLSHRPGEVPTRIVNIAGKSPEMNSSRQADSKNSNWVVFVPRKPSISQTGTEGESMNNTPESNSSQQSNMNSANMKVIMPKKRMLHQFVMENSVKKGLSVGYTKVIPSSQYQLLNIHHSCFIRLIIFTSNYQESFYEYRCTSKFVSDKFKCITCNQLASIDVDENGKIVVNLRFTEPHLCRPLSVLPENCARMKIIQKPNYEFFTNCGGQCKQSLVVFVSTSRKECYEFLCKSSLKLFCAGCIRVRADRAVIPKAQLFNKGTPKEFVAVVDENHVCEKRRFRPDKYQLYSEAILKPYFEIRRFHYNGKEGRRLVIYDPEDESKCYRYFYLTKADRYYCRECCKKGKSVSAKLHQNGGIECIILSNVEHICQLNDEEKQQLYIPREKKPFIPKIEIDDENHVEMLKKSTFTPVVKSHLKRTPVIPKIVIRPPEFLILEQDTSIFAFIKIGINLGYVFCKQPDGFYYCKECRRVYQRLRRQEKDNTIVAGNLINDGEYTFEMQPNQRHLCEPVPYQPELLRMYRKPWHPIIPKTYDFFFYRQKKMLQALKLAVLAPSDKKLCYKFVYLKNQNVFVCSKCTYKRKYVSIRLQKDDTTGAEFFEHDLKRHICEPIDVSTLSGPSFIKLKDHGLVVEPKPKTVRQKVKVEIDESKVVRMPFFELRPNKAGIPDKRLILLHPMNPLFCYEYYFDTRNEKFVCSKCQTMKNHAYARTHMDEDELFIVLGRKDHICDPIIYQPYY